MTITIAQISDSHLFADINACHCGVNVYQNFKQVISQLSKIDSLNAIVFTGDLTQDHSIDSYRVFQQTVLNAKIEVPFYYLAGNHDEPNIMANELAISPFINKQGFSLGKWRFTLLATKSDTPAGVVSQAELARLNQESQLSQYHWCFMHHHPINVGYFIDRHPLINAEQFWQRLNNMPSTKGVSCGHIHRALHLTSKLDNRNVDVLTCPATSIQFDPKADTVSALEQGPGFRLLTFENDGSYHSTVHYLS